MKFIKMHGCGNSYVYVDGRGKGYSNEFLGRLSEWVSDKSKGIGSDGLIVIDDSDLSDGRMRMFNADGSEGAMCGNGIRCVAKFIFEQNGIHKKEMRIETKSGIKKLSLSGNSDQKSFTVDQVTVEMGAPEFAPEKIPVITGEKNFVKKPLSVEMPEGTSEYEATCVSMGNPHCVIFTEGIDDMDLEKVGPAFEHHPLFPDRINTEFAEIIDRRHVRMRVWERGSGETMACGTGACAVVAAGVKTGRLDPGQSVEVRLRGGNLFVTYDIEEDQIYMAGEAVQICEGTFCFEGE